MPLGYNMVTLQHTVSGVIQEMYPAEAQEILDHPWFSQFYVEPGAFITATYHTSAVDSADLTTYTFSAQAIGTASSTRRVVVAVGTNSTRVISSATIGGITATVDGTHTLAGVGHIEFISAVVPTGTTADVVVTLDAAGIGMGIGVWTLDDGDATGQTATDDGDPISLTVTTGGGQAVIAYAFTTTVTTAVFLWSGATERFNEDVYSTTATHSGADTPSSGGSTIITMDPSSVNTLALAVAYG